MIIKSSVGKREVVSMEEERIIDKLRKGEKVLCEICKNDYMDIKLRQYRTKLLKPSEKNDIIRV